MKESKKAKLTRACKERLLHTRRHIDGMLSQAKLAPPNTDELICLCLVDTPAPARTLLGSLRCLVDSRNIASPATLD